MNYSDEEKKAFIEEHSENGVFKGGSEEEKAQYISFVEEGVRKGWKEALYCKAYGCYGGDEAFDTDWEASRDCLLKLVETEDDAFLCNTLGYIYYYGRCNGGVPQYDQALKYFTVGAFNGIFESRYKLADMLSNGYGVPRNQQAATNILLKLYDENIEIFQNEGYDGKFADVALRVGALYEYGLGVEQSDIFAYAFYEQASYALAMRRSVMDFFGDDKVNRRINEALDRVRSKLDQDFFVDELVMNHPGPIGDMLEDTAGLDIELSFRKGKYYLTAKRFVTDKEPKKHLVTLPMLEYCELVDSLELRLEGVSDLSTDQDDFKAFIHEIAYNEETESWEFIYHNSALLTIKCEEFVFERPPQYIMNKKEG